MKVDAYAIIAPIYDQSNGHGTKGALDSAVRQYFIAS